MEQDDEDEDDNMQMDDMNKLYQEIAQMKKQTESMGGMIKNASSGLKKAEASVSKAKAAPKSILKKPQQSKLNQELIQEMPESDDSDY